MKSLVLITIVSLSFLNSSAQCDSLVISRTDKMSDQTTHRIKKQILISKDASKTGLFINLLNSGGTIVMDGTAYGASKCIGPKNNMIVLFRDDTKFVVSLDNVFDCKGIFTVFFSELLGKKSELDMLATKEIETIRVWTSKGYVQEDFTVAQSELFLESMKCLINK